MSRTDRAPVFISTAICHKGQQQVWPEQYSRLQSCAIPSPPCSAGGEGWCRRWGWHDHVRLDPSHDPRSPSLRASIFHNRHGQDNKDPAARPLALSVRTIAIV